MSEWRPVCGYEGRYEVSDAGEVRSLLRRRILVIRQRPGPRGYLRVTLSFDGVEKDYRVHVLVLEAFVGPRPDGQMARHLNDVRTDNRLENLAWGTQSDNQIDSVRNGIHANASKTHCPYGHEYTPDNVYWDNGRRHCKECRNMRAREKYATRQRTPPGLGL